MILNNINSISVRRTARNFVNGINKMIKFHSPQTFYTIPCKAQVVIQNQVYFSTKHCDGWFSDTEENVIFPLNLAILRHYFQDDDILADTNTAVELNDTILPNYQNLQSINRHVILNWP